MKQDELKYRLFSQELINTAARESGRYNPVTKALVTVIVRHKAINTTPGLIRPRWSCKECSDEQDTPYACPTIKDIAKELGVELP